MADYTDHFDWSTEGVRLHGRIYPGDPARPTLLCIPGLTRNVRDFANFADHFAPRFPIVTISLRGRGESGYAPDPLTYVPPVYLSDIQRYVASLHRQSLVLVGTSLGGLLGMLLGPVLPERIVGLVLNDVGPEIMPAGQERVQEMLGKGGNWPSWLHAARDLAARQADIYPDWQLNDWLAHAKRLCRISRKGRIVWDYDPGIAAPFALPRPNAPLDLWLALEQFHDVPILSIRGETSDILSAETQEKMAARMPGLSAITIPRTGHAPTLDEPEAIAALEEFMRKLPA